MLSATHGRFIWYDLMTTDQSAAIDFYTKVIGWTTQAWEGPIPDTIAYSMWMQGETEMGGLMDQPEGARAMGAPPYWLPYIATDDVETTLERALELGATLLAAVTSIPHVGRFAILADPQGAVFGAFTPNDDPGQGPPPVIGEQSWHDLRADDHAAALAFYSDLFDWQVIDTMDMGPMGPYVMYGQRGRAYGGVCDKPATAPVASWLVYVRVADLDAAIATACELGGTLFHGPNVVPGGDRVAQLFDPQGAAFALHESNGGAN